MMSAFNNGSQKLSIGNFVDLVVGTVDFLTTLSFITKSQTRCLKKELMEDAAIVLGDFAEY